jgi:predicted PurR-regulated permease PerM
MSSLATVLLFVIVAVFALIAVGMLAVVAIALIKLNKQLEKLTDLAEPIAVKASDTLDQVQRVTVSVGEKADQILTRGVDLTDNVSSNVERTANVVQQTVTKPLIKLSSVIAGVSKTISVYSGNSRNNGHSRSGEEPKE